MPDLGLMGMRIITSEWLTEAGEPYEVRRTWRERLFSRPWHPLRVTRTVVPQVPMKGAVQLNAHTLVIHPAMLSSLRQAAADSVIYATAQSEKTE